jgi:hypothetical protein
MNKRSKQFLRFLLCASIFSISACSTTTRQLGPSRATMNHHGLANGDVVLVYYAKKIDARSSSEKIRITDISESGISGTDENGEAVNAGYDEIYQIEYKKVGPIKSDSTTLSHAGKTVEVSSKAMLYVTTCLYGGGCGLRF